jgi:hypothetical protein
VAADYLEVRRGRAWFVPAILLGIPVGLLRQVWIEASRGDPDSRHLFAFLVIVGLCGVVGILGFMLYLFAYPEKKTVGGLRRSFWFLGLPAAWCLGVSIGVLWRYI